jgi:hypothetical protein
MIAQVPFPTYVSTWVLVGAVSPLWPHIPWWSSVTKDTRESRGAEVSAGPAEEASQPGQHTSGLH